MARISSCGCGKVNIYIKNVAQHFHAIRQMCSYLHCTSKHNVTKQLYIYYYPFGLAYATADYVSL